MSATTDAIRKAADALVIQDVYLRSSRLSLAPDYDPKLGPEVKSTNLAWGVKRAQILEVEAVGTSEKMLLWKVEFQARCRLLKEAVDGKEIKNERMDSNSLVIVDTMFIAEYRLKDRNVDHEALNEFSKHNVAYHVWPYWREYLHDIMARALLPRVTLPMHVFRPGKSSDKEEGKAEA
jgi:hypothetical protein